MKTKFALYVLVGSVLTFGAFAAYAVSTKPATYSAVKDQTTGEYLLVTGLNATEYMFLSGERTIVAGGQDFFTIKNDNGVIVYPKVIDPSDCDNRNASCFVAGPQPFPGGHWRLTKGVRVGLILTSDTPFGVIIAKQSSFIIVMTTMLVVTMFSIWTGSFYLVFTILK